MPSEKLFDKDFQAGPRRHESSSNFLTDRMGRADLLAAEQRPRRVAVHCQARRPTQDSAQFPPPELRGRLEELRMAENRGLTADGVSSSAFPAESESESSLVGGVAVRLERERRLGGDRS